MSEKEVSHNILEKVVFATGLLILAAVMGYLGYLVFKGRSKPPKLVIESTYQPDMDFYAYKVLITNTGEETATSANIKLALYQEGKSVATGSIGISYIPIRSTETAWMVFHRKRKPGDSLVVSSITFLKP